MMFTRYERKPIFFKPVFNVGVPYIYADFYNKSSFEYCSLTSERRLYYINFDPSFERVFSGSLDISFLFQFPRNLFGFWEWTKKLLGQRVSL